MSIICYPEELHFGNWICFCQVKATEALILLGLLERANLNHWATYISISTAIYVPEVIFCQWGLE
jgi:hypothetical protein